MVECHGAFSLNILATAQIRVGAESRQEGFGHDQMPAPLWEYYEQNSPKEKLSCGNSEIQMKSVLLKKAELMISHRNNKCSSGWMLSAS